MWQLKPKMKLETEKAYVYKRYTDLEKSFGTDVVLQTSDLKYWTFNTETEQFFELENLSVTFNGKIIQVADWTQLLSYHTKHFVYNPNTHKFTEMKKEYKIFVNETGKKFVYLFGQSYYKFSVSNGVVSVAVTAEEIGEDYTVVTVNGGDILTNAEYKDVFRAFNTTIYKLTTPPQLNTIFGNVGKYQTNKYYYSGAFDFVIKGDIQGSTTQIVKGNIVELSTMTVNYYNDYIDLKQDDLVVIGNRLYSVENPSVSYKRQPKKYAIYTATLNSIL